MSMDICHSTKTVHDDGSTTTEMFINEIIGHVELVNDDWLIRWTNPVLASANGDEW